MKSISLPPYAPTLIESTRAIGYTLEAAISDIIDNSISAQAKCADIFFFPTGDSYIAIMDDGYGMNAKELDAAMRYGSQNPNERRNSNDLGRFGLGLKTASLSQCRTLTVVSKQKKSIQARRWDIDHIIKTEDWSLLILDEDEELNKIPCIGKLKELESGTLVVWQNLDRLQMGELDFERSMGKKMDDMRKHISLIFHRYLSGEPNLKKLKIRMNNTNVTSADPFLVERNTQVISDEFIICQGSKILIRPYILPHISDLSNDEIEMLGGKDGLRRKQGFYVYRNKRLLIWGTWFRMMRQGESSKLARVQIDIPNELDALWTLDIKKSTAIPPEIVRNNLAPILNGLAEKSKRTWEFRGRREIDNSIVHIWQRFKGLNDGYYYKINREHPLVKTILNSTPQKKRNIESLLKSIEISIPFNQLYLDLTSEKKIKNDIEISEVEIESILIGLLEQIPTKSAKVEMLEQLEMTEPFINYPQLLMRYKGEDLYVSK